MLIRELIARHVGHQGALYERGIRLDQTQVPPGLLVHHEGEDSVAPAAGDLLLVIAPVGPGMREHIDTDLPIGATEVLLLRVEAAELPVGRLLAALAVAGLQVVEAAVVSGTPAATVAVVATRTDELVAPVPYLAHELEPGDSTSPAVLRRVFGEHALEGLVQRARERALQAQLAEIKARVRDVNTELEQLLADRQNQDAIVAGHEVMLRDLETARTEVITERKATQSLARELDTARKEAETERKLMQSLRSSRSFKVAARLARVSGVGRRIIGRPGHGSLGG